ncbi:MAG: T9SS type A sorting domain-containing protein [Chlorobiota bacterium]|nr:MAG: T9SS type A sorting domain-containing protein [Chlorobiota bacterium]
MKYLQISTNKIFIVLTISFFSLIISNLYSQKSRYGLEEGQSGTIYSIALPDTSGNTEDARHPTIYPDNVYIMIYSGVDQTLEMLKPNGVLEKVVLKAYKISKYEVITAGKVKGGNPQITIPNLPQANKLFVLKSEKPIIVYVMFDTRFGTEAWTPLPAESWGTDYYSVGVPGQPINNVFTAGEYTYSTAPKLAVGQFVVAALDSDTHVSLTDPTYTSDVVTHRYYPSDTKISFTLNENFANLIESDVDTLQRNLGVNQPDAGGVRVTTDKPVGMISGNTRTMGGIRTGSLYGAGKTTMLNMLMEAVAPIETHGKEFVYMPTWDSRRPTDIPPAKGKGGVRLREYGRFYGTSKNDTSGDDVTNIELTNPGPIGLPMRKRNVKLGQGTLVETITGINGEGIEFDPQAAYYMKADKPTQATKISTSVSFVVANSTDGSGTYNTWAPFMVEMVPVEQWVTFAPGFTPVTGTYDNNLNICTDSLNKDDIELVNEGGSVTKINFNRKIPGSPYVWTNVGLNSAMKFIVQSKSGKGKFFGDVSGTGNGSEQYQPGTTKKKDDDKNGNETQGGGKDKVLHPSDYYTTNAHSYGYPLAPNRLTLFKKDSIILKVNQDCKSLNINAKLIGLLSKNSAGFRMVRSVNFNKTKIIWNTPSKITSIIGLNEVNFSVIPINPSSNVVDTIELISKTGQVWSIPFQYVAEKIILDKYLINFGKVKLGISSTVEELIVKSNLGKILIIDSIQFKNKLGYEIVSLSNSLPVVLSIADSLIIKIKINPKVDMMNFNDTLIIKSKCNNYLVLLTSTKSDEPCISVNDLNFGLINNQTFKELPLHIKNVGDGELIFIDQNGKGPIVWSESAFSISKLDQNLLLNSKIKSGDSININVMFKSSRLGQFNTTAKIFTNAICQKDTTLWIGESSTLKEIYETNSNLEFSLFRNIPEPFTNETVINYYIQNKSNVKFELYDQSGKLVKSIEEGVMEFGEHKLKLSGNELNTGLYYLKMIVDNQSKSIKLNYQK